MNLFWDTSALLSLILDEPDSASAQSAWERSDIDYAWRWLAVEAVSGLARRGARPGQWDKLQEVLDDIRFVDISPSDVHSLCRENRDWELRAADAGHLHVFRKMGQVMPDLELVSFDREMKAVAKRLGLALWGESGGRAGAQLREARSSYGRGKKRGKTGRDS
jgi:predicted nucleic acid-binding protein